MKKYSLIHLRSEKFILSKKNYLDWKEIQNDYDDYMTSIEFETLEELNDYLSIEYKLSLINAGLITQAIITESSDCIELIF
jgi:hypothetical protein